jgi:hypothetical protein
MALPGGEALRRLGFDDVAAAEQEAAVNNQVAVGIDDAGAVVGVGEQAAQDRTRFSGSMGKSRPSTGSDFALGVLGEKSSSESGLMTMLPVSAVAEPAMAPAMICACVVRLCTRASIRPWRNWLK